MNGLAAVRSALGFCIASAAIISGSVHAQSAVFGGAGVGDKPTVLDEASGTIAATASGGEHVWTHASGAENWIGTNIAVGDSGRLVVSQFQGLLGSTRLFRAEDSDPPTPLWQNSVPYMSWSTRVDAAKRADVLATFHFSQPSATAPRVPTLSVYSSASATPLWSYAFPFSVITPRNGLNVSADGETIVAWVFDFGTMTTAVGVFGRTSSIPRSFMNVQTSGVPMAVKLSSDGSSLYIASSIKTFVLDVAHGTIAYQVFNIEGMSGGHAISGDGSIFAHALSQRSVALFRRQDATYVPWSTFTLDSDAVCQNLAISDDGSTMACGYNYGYPYLQVRTVVLNLTSATPTVVLDDSITGGGAWMNTMTDLALSARGDVLVAGLSGDANGAAPEVEAYAKDSSGAWSRVYQFDLPGSVNDVDISADGTRIAVASKAVHNSVAGSGGRLDTFKLTPVTVSNDDLTWSGVPSIGSTLTFRHTGLTPGRPAQLMVSEEVAAPPLVYPGVGTLYLRRDRITVEAIGNADQDGVFTCQVAIPSDPALIGDHYYVQSIGLEPAQLSQTWLTITIQP